MINKLNAGTGCDSAPGIFKTRNISSRAVRAGAFVQKAVGTNTLLIAVQTSNLQTTAPIVGLTTSVTTTSSTVIDMILVACGDMMEFDVPEIAAGTTLTATGGSSTTFVMATLKGLTTNAFIGATVQVIAMASGDKTPGTILTVTAHTFSTGTLTFASLGTTGFASGDTIKVLTLDDNYVAGDYGVQLNTTYGDSIDLVSTNANTQTNVFVRITGTSGDGKRLQGMMLTGYDINPSS